MKQNRFIELLNLYLDGALPSTEAAELEREILDNPARHKIYRHYCQMQRACGLLAERFRDEAVPATRFRDGSVSAQPAQPRHPWLQPAAWAATGALAACLAFAVVQFGFTAKPAVATNAPAPTSAVAVNVTSPHTPFATPVVAANSALFRNPWRTTPVFPPRAVGWQQLPVSERPLTLVVPPLMQLTDAEGNVILPAGLPENANTLPALRMEDVEAAAFQFQR